MLVECKNCGVSFDHALRECVACETPYVLSRDEQRSECLKVVERMARQGEKRQPIREYLMESDLFSEEEIRRVLKAIKQSQESHGPGSLLLSIGAFLLALGGTGWFSTPLLLFVCYGIGGTLAAVGLVAFKSEKENAMRDPG